MGPGSANGSRECAPDDRLRSVKNAAPRPGHGQMSTISAFTRRASRRRSFLLGGDVELEDLCRTVLQIALQRAENQHELFARGLGVSGRVERKDRLMWAADHQHAALQIG